MTTLGTTSRASIPWGIPGVEKLAVQTVMAMKIWDPNMQQQLRGNLMRTYKDGIYMFVSSLKRSFLINLSKDPSWQTIQNRVVRVLLKHRAFRNKQRSITGDGERAGATETESARRERLDQETLYDDALALYTQHQEFKKKRAEEVRQQKDEEAALITAGRPSTNAAMANMSNHMHFDEIGTETDNETNETTPQRRARERRENRRASQNKRKAEVIQEVFRPLVEVLQDQNKHDRKQARRELKFRRSQARIDNKLTGIMCAVLGKDTLTTDQKRRLFDFTNDVESDSEPSSESES